MKNPHFFGLHSRLGIYHKPHLSDSDNIGVESGPSVIVRKFFNQPLFDQFWFPLPENIPSDKYLDILARFSHQAADLISNQIKPRHEVPVILGGDHSVVFAGLLGLLELYPAQSTGIVMFDSHADLHQNSTSPSGNFHGMWLRPFFDEFDVKSIRQLIKHYLEPIQLRYIGNLIVEEAEQQFIKNNQIICYSSYNLKNPDQLDLCQANLQKWSQQFDHLHLSFDVDVFNSKLVSATGTPNPKGMNLKEVIPFLHMFANHPGLSISLVEVNPAKDGATQTLEIAHQVLQILINAK